MHEITAVTILSRNLLPHAATLAQSLAQTNPSVRLKAYLLDEFPQGFEHSKPMKDVLEEGVGSFDILPLSRLSVATWEKLKFQYTPLELACAMKPFSIKHALDNFSSKVIYCDSDLFFYEPLETTISLLDDHNILLTPHLSAWKPDEGDQASPKFLNINQGGIFNAGFLAVRQSESTEYFLDWWQQRCEQHCYIDLTCGIFVDQKWLDFVPALFDGVHVDRSASLNVGHWNLVDRQLRQNSDGNWTVGDNGEALKLFHFSGFDAESPWMLTKHDGLINFDTSPFLPLLKQYADRINHFEPKKYKSLGYEFAALPDGTPIRETWREAVRSQLLPETVLRSIWDPESSGKVKKTLESLEPQARDQRLLWRVENLQTLVGHLLESSNIEQARGRIGRGYRIKREIGRLSEQIKRAFFSKQV